MLLNNIISFIADPIINNKEVADSISNELKSSASKLSSLSFDEIIQKLVDGAVDIGMRILIAIVVFYIGKLIINKIHTIVKNVMIKHSLDKSLTTFVLSLVKITLLFVLIDSVIGILGIHCNFCLGRCCNRHGIKRHFAKFCRRSAHFIYKTL